MHSESDKMVDLGALAAPRPSIPRLAISKAQEIRHRMPASLKIKLKILFSILMFASLPFFLKIDPAKTWAAIKHTNLWILGATGLLVLSTLVVNARRWQIIANALGFKKPFGELVEYCYVGMFFNLFLPSTVGGDFTRCYYISKGTGKYKDALFSVLADRVSGIAILFASASVGILLSPGARDMPWQLKLPIFAGSIGLFVVMPFMPMLTRRLLGQSNWITRQFNNSNAQIFWQDKRLVAASLGWSILSQLIFVACHVGVALALGVASQIPIWYYFVFYPCVAVLGFVTPSFNGIGIREWAYSYFLVMMKVDHSIALTYALLWLLLTTLMSLVGGVVYVMAKLAPPPPQEED
ncbi:MAG TPA: lysylphosphatidylglycerol synthase transmembrane domain-containing protein [Candidatus Obscuribacterales bacterium]